MSENPQAELHFKGVCLVDSDGEVSCFCSSGEVESGACKCVGKVGCFEMEMDLKLIRQTTKPHMTDPLSAAERDLRRLGSSAENIKKGLAKLESAVRKNNNLFRR